MRTLRLTNPAGLAAEQANPSRPIVRLLSLHNFLRFAALGLSAPFINLYVTSLGFSGTELGVLISIGALLELSVTPIANSIADRLGRHRLLYKIMIGTITACNLLLGITHARFLIGSVFVLNNMMGRGSISLLAQLTVTRLDEYKLSLFGRVRMWGSVGWAITTILSGSIIAIGSYPLVFIASALVSSLKFPFMAALPRETSTPHSRAEERPPRHPGIYTLMISQFLFYTGMNAVMSFIWIVMRHDLGVPTTQIGYYAAFFAIAEIVPMLFVDRFTGRIGLRNMLIVGMFGEALIWIGYGLTPSALGVVGLQFLRSTMFTMFLTSLTVLTSRISHPANVATNQALIQVTMPALAVLLTSPIAGWIYDNLGRTYLFTFAAMVGVAACVFLMLSYHRLKEHETA